MILTSLIVASFYVGGSAPGEGGDWTASGQRYDKHAFTAAHPRWHSARSYTFVAVVTVSLW
jgi:hypothetical protein